MFMALKNRFHIRIFMLQIGQNDNTIFNTKTIRFGESFRKLQNIIGKKDL